MTHRIYPYSPLHQVVSNVWQVQGTLAMPGIVRNMTVYRDAQGRLVLYSVVAMHEPDMRALEALGTPSVLVMPHDRHKMDVPFYRKRYPDLTVVDGTFDALHDYGVEASFIPGTTYHDVAMRLPTDRGHALCVCETLGNMEGANGVVKLLMKVIGPSGGEAFGVARAVKWREVRDKEALRAFLGAEAMRPGLHAIVMGHGPAITQLASERLSHAATHL